MIKIKKKNPFLIFIVVFGLLIFLHWTGLLRPLENFLLKVSEPISGQLYKKGTDFNSNYNKREEKDVLLSQIDELIKEVERLTVANADWKEIADENKKLRGQLNFSTENNFKTIVAEVIAKEALADISDAEQDIVLNKGKRDGLDLGLAVANEQGVIVGKIIEMKDSTAKVCLVTSRNCRLAAAIQNETQTIGLTEGDLGLTIKMNFIPQSEEININDTVITSGLGGKIPRGLVIGKITMVNSESNDVWQSATIDPLINLNNLTIVSVIHP